MRLRKALRILCKKKFQFFWPQSPVEAVFWGQFFFNLFFNFRGWKSTLFCTLWKKEKKRPELWFLRFTKSRPIEKSSFPVAVAERPNFVLRVQFFHFLQFWPYLSHNFSPWDQKWNIFTQYRFLLPVRCQNRAKILFSVDREAADKKKFIANFSRFSLFWPH